MSVIDARHGRHRHPITVDLADQVLLDLPEAQPIIARLGASIDPDYPHHREQLLRVAIVAIRAKQRPFNKFARPTL